MANVIKLKRSAVAGKAPVVGDLQLGELGLNTYDGKLFTKKSVSGVESIVEIGAAAGNQDYGLITGSITGTLDYGALS